MTRARDGAAQRRRVEGSVVVASRAEQRREGARVQGGARRSYADQGHDARDNAAARACCARGGHDKEEQEGRRE